MEASRPEQGEKEARAACRGDRGQLERRGAELAPKDQADERAGQARKDSEEERRRDVDAQGASSFRVEFRSDHVRPRG